MNSMDPLWPEFSSWVAGQGMYLNDIVQLPDDEYGRVVAAFHRSRPGIVKAKVVDVKTCEFCGGPLTDEDPDFCSDQCSKADTAAA